MRTIPLLAVLLIASVALGEDKPKSDSGANGAPLKIHILSGAKEYKSEPSLKEFSAYLEKGFKITCTASWVQDGATHLPDLDKLKDAELLFVFARRLKLPEEQMKVVRAHWEQGRPIVGLRTASHAFQQADNEIFDKKVMGGHYKGHFGDEAVKVAIVDAAKDHPVLRGVKPFDSGKLYSAGELSKETVVLLTGEMGKEKHSVAWVHTCNGGRTFYSSLGVPEDFKDENFRRMLVNAILWTTHRDAGKMKK